MTPTDLEQELQGLGEDLHAAASTAAEAIICSTLMLGNRYELAGHTLARNIEWVDSSCFRITHEASVLAGAYPRGIGPRFLKSIPSACLELSRITHYARAISELAVRRDSTEAPTLLSDLQCLAFLDTSCLRFAVSAVVSEDLWSAQLIRTRAVRIQALYEMIYHDCLDLAAAQPACVQHLQLILTVAHDLRCIGEHSVRVYEQAMLVATGDWSPGYVPADELLLAVA